MRFHFTEAAGDPAHWLPLARAVEDAGFTGICLADSLAYPSESDAKYPYTDDGNREFLRGKAFIEPLVLAAALTAATTRLHVTPFVLKLPVRPPVLVAKQAASIAALSGNRLSLGVGISPWPQDFTMMGVPFPHRGRRLDECIDIVRGLCGGGPFQHHGEFYDIPEIEINPVPTQPLPILLGGHSDAALRRSVIRGDGWMSAGASPADLDTMLAKLSTLRRDLAPDKTFRTFAVSRDAFTPAGVARLAQSGVTDAIIGFRGLHEPGPDHRTLDERIEQIQKFAATVIAETGTAD
ncbi:TIGR03619 family F420-dependent LLM class oxidoreductase [Nocardia tengchongensis]|uniref:TIGR03619 family F420-dependent LLM class oxidoreductase n=1 Tax=Nocardia tengchongensis TaxID=2055889 RepID=UPI00367C2B6D